MQADLCLCCSQIAKTDFLMTGLKYLGITISDNLSWSPYIDSISKKANQTLGFLKWNIKVHNKNLTSIAYTTLNRPQLEYASTVLSSTDTATDITKLEAVQHRAACWATRDFQHTSSVTQMIKDFKWRTLEQPTDPHVKDHLWSISHTCSRLPNS